MDLFCRLILLEKNLKIYFTGFIQIWPTARQIAAVIGEYKSDALQLRKNRQNTHSHKKNGWTTSNKTKACTSHTKFLQRILAMQQKIQEQLKKENKN